MDPKVMEIMIKVGPNGITLGHTWDERGKNLLTQIFIFYDSICIKSIQTAYILDGKLRLSNKHGGNGDMFKAVEIDYPSEFLTGISGYYSYDSPYAVKSLMFETNRRKFGPLGPEEGTHFCIQMGTNQRLFGGFHGTSNSDYLYSIGAYVKAINPLEDIESHTSTIPTTTTINSALSQFNGVDDMDPCKKYKKKAKGKVKGT